MACCLALWYCTDFGRVKVLPDTEGHYAKPPGYRSGPYETEIEAAAVCTGEQQSLSMSSCCPSPFAFPRSVTFFLLNRNGWCVDVSQVPFYPASFTMDLTTPFCSGGSCFWPNPAFIMGEVTIVCNPSFKYLTVAWRTCNMTISGQDPFWSIEGPLPTNPRLIRNFNCGDDLSASALNLHPYIGRFSNVPAEWSGVGGYFDLYVYWG